MKKQLFLLVIMLLPLAVSASTRKVKIDGINYLIDSSSKTAEVVKWSGLDNEYRGDIVIPPSITDYGQDYMVTGMRNGVFESCTELTSVTIPHSVTSIGDGIFEGCTSLTSINIEEGNPVFDSRDNCNAIIETASNKLIYGCKSTVIPQSVTTIGSLAFFGYNGPTSIVIPDGVVSIENEAFKNCHGLTSVTIGNNVTSIEYEAFCNCSNLKTVELNNNAIVSKNYDSETEPTVRNLFGSQVEEYILGEEVTSIGDGAFYGCSNLTSVQMSDNVMTIGEKAFCYCSQLTSINLSANLTIIGDYAFQNCQSLTFITIPKSVERIGFWAFGWCFRLTKVVIIGNAVVSRENEQFYSMPSCFGKQVKEYVLGEEVTKIGDVAFYDSNELVSINIPSYVTNVGDSAFYNCNSMTDVYCYAEQVPETGKDVFVSSNYTNATLHVPAASIDAYRNAEQWKDFGNIVALPAQDDYRPFIEDDKVWKVGDTSENPVQMVEYYYFDGDTIINGKTCKQMMCQRYINPEYPDYGYLSQSPSLSKVGAWYEEDKKVYFYNAINQLKMMYDFSLEANDTLQFLNVDGYPPLIIGSKQTGGLEGFKGVYRDIMMCVDEGQNLHSTFWLEGVGSIMGPITNTYYHEKIGIEPFLMSCTVGDEVIYLNDEYKDGATPEAMEAKKHRFDFTHTVKNQPKAPIKRVKSEAESSEMQSLYGEYNERQLGINLDPLDDAYIVRITNESGNVVYEKAINAGSIVALSIDISAYAKGCYTVTMENSSETFTGEFETQATGIKAITNKKEERHYIYNLQGQRLSSLQKGLNIVDGRKIIVK